MPTGAAADSGVRLQLVTRDERFLVELPQDGSPALRMVPDSGADRLVVFAPCGAPRAFDFEPGAEPEQVATATGTRKVRSGIVKQLQLGRIRLRNQPAVEIDAGAGEAASDGLLPLHRFSSVSFEAAGYIVIRP
jgi:hypothetical protein